MANQKIFEETSKLQHVSEPLPRLKASQDLADDLTTALEQVYAVRRNTLDELVESGMKQTEIANALGVTRGRIGQLLKQGVKSERAFFGKGQITVAIGAKPEIGRQDSAEKFVVSTDAMRAAQILIDQVRVLGLDAITEEVPPPGLVELNRESLVVLTSPRLLPFIKQVLAADPYLSFETTDSGWKIKDKISEKLYEGASPDEDYAYVGRLPRPDGNGNFLYIAGIHSEGTLGAVEWVSDHVADLYQKFKVGNFSVLLKVDSNRPDDSRKVSQVYDAKSWGS